MRGGSERSNLKIRRGILTLTPALSPAKPGAREQIRIERQSVFPFPSACVAASWKSRRTSDASEFAKFARCTIRT